MSLIVGDVRAALVLAQFGLRVDRKGIIVILATIEGKFAECTLLDV